MLDVWKPTADRKAIINLPVTVELSSPHVYADQVEYMCDNLKYRDAVVVSLHPHNDRGCAVADSELGILQGQTESKARCSETASVPAMWISLR